MLEIIHVYRTRRITYHLSWAARSAGPISSILNCFKAMALSFGRNKIEVVCARAVVAGRLDAIALIMIDLALGSWDRSRPRVVAALRGSTLGLSRLSIVPGLIVLEGNLSRLRVVPAA